MTSLSYKVQRHTDRNQIRFQVLCCGLLLAISSGCADGTSTAPTAQNQPDTEAEAAAMMESSNTTEHTSETAQDTPDKTENTAQEFGPAPEGKVLRHAVFFSFREESTEEDIQRIVEAFRELPSKIEEIIDFAWGTNNSPEGLDDGFTHCFLLTFKDEAGRATYLPHPAHRAFGDVLRGHNDKVFVIDYWGNDEEPIEKALKHAVFFRFKEDASPADIKKVEDGFASLPSKIDAIKQFEWGTNNSPEKHDAGFTHCFMVTFESEEGRDVYLPHADHQAFVEVLKPVLDAPRVLDFWAQK